MYSFIKKALFYFSNILILWFLFPLSYNKYSWMQEGVDGTLNLPIDSNQEFKLGMLIVGSLIVVLGNLFMVYRNRSISSIIFFFIFLVLNILTILSFFR